MEKCIKAEVTNSNLHSKPDCVVMKILSSLLSGLFVIRADAQFTKSNFIKLSVP